jgi:hypothetical protein
MEIPGNEANITLIHHKVMRNTSHELDSEADWMEEN